jgi:2-polyprenyl-6-hydroxyphenyl methylase/3-demethylubiquinone-9 3-methyltransferase
MDCDLPIRIVWTFTCFGGTVYKQTNGWVQREHVVGLGTRVRRLFGRYERNVAAAYRRFFVDLDAFAAELGRQVPDAKSILEIGCGEGQMTERLVRIYPRATVLGIDLIEEPGRLFRGDTSRVRFASTSLASIAGDQPSFDLVVLADVLHHLPLEARSEFLSLAGATVAPGGTFALKDWARIPTLGYALGYCADRFITGDPVVYHLPDQLRVMAGKIFAHGSVIAEWRIPPWQSNICLLVVNDE